MSYLATVVAGGPGLVTSRPSTFFSLRVLTTTFTRGGSIPSGELVVPPAPFGGGFPSGAAMVWGCSVFIAVAVLTILLLGILRLLIFGYDVFQLLQELHGALVRSGFLWVLLRLILDGAQDLDHKELYVLFLGVLHIHLIL